MSDWEEAEGEDGDTIEGPRIAARIINRMSAPQRTRVMREISKKSPETFQRIQKDLVAIEDIVQLTDQGLQYLIAQMDYDDLLAVIANTDAAIGKALLSNMSQRKRVMVRNDLNYARSLTKAEFDQVEKRVLAKLDELRTAGAVRMRPEDEDWV